MSAAGCVPETWELTGDDARRTLRQVRRRELLAGAFRRLRAADGFSHARSLAFLTALLLIQGVIGFVGLASALGDSSVSEAVTNALQAAVPGPAGEVLTEAVGQARQASGSGELIALLVGVVGSLITATTIFGQFERALNRLYGVEQDRPSLAKYTRAFLLAITAGTLSLAAMVVVAFGQHLAGEGRDDGVATAWTWVRWPLALVLIAASMALLFRWCPKRRQPSWSWLAFGAGVSTLGWVVVTGALATFFSHNSSFGDTYGPLAGFVALLMWALLSADAVLYGAAVAAQLEAVRAGAGETASVVRAGA